MKKLGIAVAVILTAALLSFGFAGCSRSGEKAEGGVTQAVGDQTASERPSVDEVAATAPEATAQVEVVEQTMPTVDAGASADSLIGDWIDITADDRFAKITKTETGYQYEDNDGVYEATFADGKLIVTVSDTETADVYLDAQTGHMYLIYQDNPTEFKRK